MPLFTKIEDSVAKSLKERFGGKQETSKASSTTAKSKDRAKKSKKEKKT